jgi:hypothetical protein
MGAKSRVAEKLLSFWEAAKSALERLQVEGCNVESPGRPPLPLFSKRYDSIVVSGWGSANDMIPWELEGQWMLGAGWGPPFQNGEEYPHPPPFL